MAASLSSAANEGPKAKALTVLPVPKAGTVIPMAKSGPIVRTTRYGTVYHVDGQCRFLTARGTGASRAAQLCEGCRLLIGTRGDPMPAPGDLFEDETFRLDLSRPWWLQWINPVGWLSVLHRMATQDFRQLESTVFLLGGLALFPCRAQTGGVQILLFMNQHVILLLMETSDLDKRSLLAWLFQLSQTARSCPLFKGKRCGHAQIETCNLVEVIAWEREVFSYKRIQQHLGCRLQWPKLPSKLELRVAENTRFIRGQEDLL